MRKILILFLLLNVTCFAQTHVEYISEKCDSMALINQSDIDVINNVFAERNKLDSLNTINNKIIETLELETEVLDSIVKKQLITIDNDRIIHQNLKRNYEKVLNKYNQDLKKERNQKTSFQITTGLGLIAIILLILL